MVTLSHQHIIVGKLRKILPGCTYNSIADIFGGLYGWIGLHLHSKNKWVWLDQDDQQVSVDCEVNQFQLTGSEPWASVVMTPLLGAMYCSTRQAFENYHISISWSPHLYSQIHK